MQNVQKVQAAKQELFMEILREDKNIKKKIVDVCIEETFSSLR